MNGGRETERKREHEIERNNYWLPPIHAAGVGMKPAPIT